MVLQPTLTLRLPFTGRWFVAQGGDTANVNHHMHVRGQWFGLDFARVGGASERELAPADPTQPSDFHGWDQPVLSPLVGLVVQARDDLPDNPLGTCDTTQPLGNYVAIASPGGLHLFLAHLRQGSVRVRPGQPVHAGQWLGTCGNSGNSTMPHIHLHVQTAPTFGEGHGELAEFEGIDVELSGRVFRDVTWPLIRGLFVQPSAP